MPLTRVLFLCIGNSCRSQMAEAFARAYGSDVIEPYSAGLAPASMVSPLTRKVLLEKNIDIGNRWPKPVDPEVLSRCDLVIDMSGRNFTAPAGLAVETWKVRDPIGEGEDVFRQVANEIEQLVMRLILRLRAADKAASRFDRMAGRFRQ